MSEKCKYELPCGWCEKFDKRCEKKTNIADGLSRDDVTRIEKIADVATSVADVATSISSTNYVKCRSCSQAELIKLPNMSDLYKCKYTGRAHYDDDNCDYLTITAQNKQ